MTMDTFETVFRSDGLVRTILTFLKPTSCSEAHERAATMSHASQRLHDLFLEVTRPQPLKLQWGGEDHEGGLEGDTQCIVVQWAIRNQLEVTELEADVSRLYIDLFLLAFAGIDFQWLKVLHLTISRRNNGFRAADLRSLFSLFAHSPLECLVLRDVNSDIDVGHSLLTVRSLRKLEVDGDGINMQHVFRDVETLSRLEHLKISGFSLNDQVINSQSLMFLDLSGVLETHFTRINCPLLKTIIIDETCHVAERSLSELLEFMVPNDDLIKSSVPSDLITQVSSIRAVPAANVAFANEITVAADCHLFLPEEKDDAVGFW